MNLGETIYKLRKEKNFSQEDLAAVLEVSRQSISKWENNTAVPELDKLVKMSEIFGVSLDELVKGAVFDEKEEITSPWMSDNAAAGTQNYFEKRKIIGTILLCTGAIVFLMITILGGFFGGLIFASPFLLCGIICFMFKHRIGLWCAWAVFFCFDLYMQVATGTSRGAIFNSMFYKYADNPLRLIIPWAIMLLLISIIGITAYSFRKSRFIITKKNIIKYCVLWVSYFAVHGIEILLSWWSYLKLNASDIPNYAAVRTEMYVNMAVNYVFSWITIILFTVILVKTVNLIGAFINKKRGE